MLAARELLQAADCLTELRELLVAFGFKSHGDSNSSVIYHLDQATEMITAAASMIQLVIQEEPAADPPETIGRPAPRVKQEKPAADPPEPIRLPAPPTHPPPRYLCAKTPPKQIGSRQPPPRLTEPLLRLTPKCEAGAAAPPAAPPCAKRPKTILTGPRPA